MPSADRIPGTPTRLRRAFAGIGTDFVPYTGAIANVDLGSYNIITTGLGTFGNLDVDTLNFNANVISDSTGTISFDNDHLTTTGNITGNVLYLAGVLNYLYVTSGDLKVVAQSDLILDPYSGWVDLLNNGIKTTGSVYAALGVFGDGGATNYVSISNTGDVTFYGSSGLIFAEIYAHAVAADITSVAQNDWDQITAFDTNGENNLATPDHTNDHITIVRAGKYLAQFYWCGHGPATAHDWDFHIAKNNNASQFNNISAHLTSPTTQKDTSVFGSGVIDLAASDTIELWVKRTSAGSNIVLTTDNCGITLTQLGGT